MSGHTEREAESGSASSYLIHLCFSPSDFKVLENLEDPHHLRAAGIAIGLGSQHSPKKAVFFGILVVLSYLVIFFLEGTEEEISERGIEAEIVTLIFSLLSTPSHTYYAKKLVLELLQLSV